MPEYNPESELDHFKVWKVKTQEFSKPVSLEGQFDHKKAIPQHLKTLEWLANPVDKTFAEKHHPARHRTAHLLGYFLAPPQEQTPRWVKVLDQFHKQAVVWKLADPAMLLVPASKVHEGTPPEPPTVVDHFECYLIRGADAVKGPVTLSDQIDRILKKTETVETLEPAFFCVPVQKNKEPIRHPRAHMVLYDITPRHTLSKAVRAIAKNQFRTWELTVEESLMLGVPAEKVAWGEGEPKTGAGGSGHKPPVG